MTQQVNPPEVVVEAAERQLRRLAIEGELLDFVEANLERIRAEVAHECRTN